jgi:hypothetical protein
MNPEFLTEGTAVDDFSHADRLVLGGVDPRTHEVLQQLYERFDQSVPRIVTTSANLLAWLQPAGGPPDALAEWHLSRVPHLGRQSDGEHDLLGIAGKSRLDFSLIARAAQALEQAGLLRRLA